MNSAAIRLAFPTQVTPSGYQGKAPLVSEDHERVDRIQRLDSEDAFLAARLTKVQESIETLENAAFLKPADSLFLERLRLTEEQLTLERLRIEMELDSARRGAADFASVTRPHASVDGANEASEDLAQDDLVQVLHQRTEAATKKPSLLRKLFS